MVTVRSVAAATAIQESVGSDSASIVELIIAHLRDGRRK